MNERRRCRDVVAGGTPLVVGVSLLGLVVAGAVIATVEVVRDREALGGLLVIPLFGAVPGAIGVGLAKVGLLALRGSRVLPAAAGSAVIVLCAVGAAANSQWLEPDLHFRTQDCGGQVCSISFVSAGLPSWNFQRVAAVGVGICALASLMAGLTALPPRRRLAGSAVFIALLVTVAVASLDHAAASAANTRDRCLTFLALRDGRTSNAARDRSTATMVDRCREPDRVSTPR